MSSTLYRKYRPNTFSGIIGQEHITATLQNQLVSGRIGHAYLFCGSRGVGKTSLARIFSHAINCINPQNAPCGSCEACKSGSGEINIDIIEIDAASNNGVDDARDLRDKVKYPPVLGKYKVYIIDEVHMLTGSAFNALLKTLEEPPAHAVFILATTEPHKLPATILSRCMRFDFRLVSMDALFALLADVFAKESKGFEDEALRAIAAAAEGSVRDALSIADTCIAAGDYVITDKKTATESLAAEQSKKDSSDEKSVKAVKSGGILTAEQVYAILGGGSKQTEDLFSAVAAADAARALTLINALYEGGKSMNVIAKELASLSRDLMIAKTAPSILKTTNERLDFLIQTAKNHTVEGLAALVQLFSEMDSALRYSVSPRIAMEAAVIRAIKLYVLDINALDERILRIENKLASLSSGVLTAEGTAAKANPDQNNSTKSPSANLKNTAPLDDGYPAAPDDYGYMPNEQAYGTMSKNEKNQSLTRSAEDSNLTETKEGSYTAPVTPSAARQSLTVIQLWGRMITYFRRNSTPGFTQVVGRQNPSKLTLKNGVLKISASREDYLLMCDNDLQDTLRQALLSENFDVKITVEKDSTDIDMEKEVNSLIEEFGESKVNIIK